jgi:hypothetical protein
MYSYDRRFVRRATTDPYLPMETRDTFKTFRTSLRELSEDIRAALSTMEEDWGPDASSTAGYRNLKEALKILSGADREMNPLPRLLSL